MLRKSFYAFTLATMVLSMVLGQGVEQAAAQETITLKIGMAKPIQAGKAFSIVKTVFVDEVSRRVAEETDYRIKWVEAYGGAVAKDGEVLEAVQMGLLDLGYVIFLFEPAKLFLHNFGYFVPFSSPDLVMVNRITHSLFSEFPIMSEIFEKEYQQKLLCVLAASSYQLITTFPVKTLDDLKGRKIAAGGPNLVVITPLGATPVQSSIGEGYTSFKTGVYEGWIILESIMAGLKWPEVAPYVTIVDLGAPPAAALTVNERTWSKLPPEVQKIVTESALLLADEGIRQVAAADQSARNRLVEMGAQVAVLDPLERHKWAERLPNTAQAKAEEANKKNLPGSALIKRYLALQEQEGYKFPRQWKVQ